ncbi:MAG: two-component system response regulator RegA [Halothiobacillaceae bacterium]|nr:MAG: two-component system response regulator RegA [Halothiobacillaceae bacterium]
MNNTMSDCPLSTETSTQPSLLVVDDDTILCAVLAAALSKRGFVVHTAHDAQSAYAVAVQELPEFVVLDLKMPGESGLTLVPKLKALDAHTRIVVLTGYASVATAVEAIKLGAVHYLTKPVDADEIVQAFWQEGGNADVPVGDDRPSVERLEWEYIQQVLRNCNGNVSATARSLGMHRRTLQRKLQKRPVKR